ncbi:hypothetical protein PYW08_012723 [Mythimna loreyi]|uniref:Uncharacterized protein n=1 Tax=Mythimna loreyi TaxID=667449 RepID=A0ACC2Q0Y0_9NEOP|nr:hypothetical protein PYW08_012723 [Mythimna loreyi]
MEPQEPKKKRKRTKKKLEKNSIAYLREREKANARKKRFLDKMTDEEKELKRAKDRAYHHRKKADKNRKIAVMSEEEKIRQREVWNRAAKKYRQRKKSASNMGNNIPPPVEVKVPATSTILSMRIVPKEEPDTSPSISQQEETLADIKPKEEVVEEKLSAEVKREVIEQDQTKIIVAKVYHYFEQEYEELKKTLEGIDQTPLSKIRQRTALATGVSETMVLEILQEEERRNEEKRQQTLQEQSRALKRLRQTDSASEDGDSDDNGDGDDGQPCDDEVTETLVIKEEPDEPENDEPEVYVELPTVKPSESGHHQVAADPIAIELKTEPPSEEATTSYETQATQVQHASKSSKMRKIQRETDTIPATNVPPAESASPGTSTAPGTSAPPRRQLLLLDDGEVKMKQLETGEDGFS